MQLSNVVFKTCSFVALFDLDGTLVHTDEANFLAYQQAVKQVMPNMSIEQQSNLRFDSDELYRQLPDLSTFEYMRIIACKRKLDNEFISHTHLNSDLVTKLKKLSQISQTYLVTNAHEARAQLTLKKHNLTHLFDGMFFKEDRGCDANKYQHALSNIAVAKENVIVFENESIQVRHAHAAGIPIQNIHKV